MGCTTLILVASNPDINLFQRAFRYNNRTLRNKCCWDRLREAVNLNLCYHWRIVSNRCAATTTTLMPLPSSGKVILSFDTLLTSNVCCRRPWRTKEHGMEELSIYFDVDRNSKTVDNFMGDDGYQLGYVHYGWKNNVGVLQPELVSRFLRTSVKKVRPINTVNQLTSQKMAVYVSSSSVVTCGILSRCCRNNLQIYYSLLHFRVV